MADSTTTLTTAAGAPVGDNQNSLTAGRRGPILLQDVHLVGVNHGSLPVNSPHAATARTYHRDGSMRVDNGGPAVNYQPNSLGGPADRAVGPEGTMPIDGPVGRYDHRAGHDDFTQAGDLYRLLAPDARARLVENIVAALGKARRAYQVRQVAHCRAADREYGDRVAAALGVE